MCGPAVNIPLWRPAVRGVRLGVDVPACGAFGPLAIHPFAVVVFGPDQSVDHQRADDREQDDQEGGAASHPRKTSTTSLAPEVVSR